MSQIVRFSLRFNNDRPISEYVRLASAAEAAGFDQFWVSDDLFLRSAPVILAAVAGATTRIQVGTCVLNPYTIHPAEMAMAAATLDELSDGRFLLGLAAGAGDFLGWIGLEQTRPLTTVLETMTVVRRLLAGERVPFNGQALRGWTSDAYLRFSARPVPIYLGAMGPRMLRAVGEAADGGLPLLFPPEHYETVASYVAEGARAGGRTLDDLDLAACVWCSIGDDRAAAEAVLRDKIAYYGHALGPLIYARLGVSREEFLPIERALQHERDPEKARALVTPAMLQIGLVGTARDLIPRLEGLVALGVRHLSFGPPLGPDPLAAIEALGREVLPHFR
ncbi:MAG: LLM class flavin-dependent oxidoreductase [Chloroflexi bacterium]|nr:LLM class flavin-dependent oxidoreductase [Chloroflexota bacterium]